MPWRCPDCEAAWPHDIEQQCPCGGGRRPAYSLVGRAQGEDEAREQAFEYYFARWDDARLKAEREVMARLELPDVQQVESD